MTQLCTRQEHMQVCLDWRLGWSVIFRFGGVMGMDSGLVLEEFDVMTAHGTCVRTYEYRVGRDTKTTGASMNLVFWSAYRRRWPL